MASIDVAVKKAFQESGFPLDYVISPDPSWWDKDGNPTVDTVEIDGYQIVLLGELLEGFAQFSNHIAGAQQKIGIAIRSAQLEILYELIIQFGFTGSEEAQYGFQYCLSGSVPEVSKLLSLEEFNKAVKRSATVEEYEDYKKRYNEQVNAYNAAIPIIESKKTELLRFYIANRSKFDSFMENSSLLSSSRPGEMYQIAAFLRERCRFRNGEEITVDIDHVTHHKGKTNNLILKLIENETQGIDPKQTIAVSTPVSLNLTPEEVLGNSSGSRKRKSLLTEETEDELTTSLLQVA